MVVLVFLGLIFTLWVKTQLSKPNLATPPVLDVKAPAPIMTSDQLKKVHEAVKDGDPAVRWAAVELMYRLHDPLAFTMLQETLSVDIDPAVRQKAVNLLKEAAERQAQNQPVAEKNVLMALTDSDKQIRIAALLALGEIGDRRSVPQITGMLDDVDADVRLQALHTLSRLQEKRQADYQKLTDELRNEYSAAAQRGKLKMDSKDLYGTGNSGN
jgi:hypothetical protein